MSKLTVKVRTDFPSPRLERTIGLSKVSICNIFVEEVVEDK